MRLTEFWDRMRAQFGDVYAESVAKDQVLAALGDRTVNQALADGEDAKTVWRAVAETFDVPERLRCPAYGRLGPAGGHALGGGPRSQLGDEVECPD